MALGRDKKRNLPFKSMYVFCLSCPSSTFALQRGGFLPREWLAAKGLFESSRNFNDFRVQFPENLRCSLKFYESESYTGSFLHYIFESKNFRFPLSTANNLTWEMKCEELISENHREFTRMRYASKIVR